MNKLGPPGRFVLRRVASVLTGTIFGSPANKLAQTWRSNGGTAATFRVDWAPANARLGACHCIELPLLFGTDADWADAGMLEGARANAALGTEMRRVWAAFAYDGVAGIGREELVFA